MFLFQILIRIQVIARGKIAQIWLQGGATSSNRRYCHWNSTLIAYNKLVLPKSRFLQHVAPEQSTNPSKTLGSIVPMFARI